MTKPNKRTNKNQQHNTHEPRFAVFFYVPHDFSANVEVERVMGGLSQKDKLIRYAFWPNLPQFNDSARAWTQTSPAEVQRANHEATTSPRSPIYQASHLM